MEKQFRTPLHLEREESRPEDSTITNQSYIDFNIQGIMRKLQSEINRAKESYR